MSQGFEREVGPDAPGVFPAGKILVADEDPDLLLAIEGTLRADGHEVVTARNGKEAVRLAREHLPWLLILDVTLPGLSGYEVCRRLRSDWRFADRGIIMLTSDPALVHRSMGLAAGADDFVLKPLDPIELAARVQLTLRRMQEMRSSSPLTGLPGNASIQRELQRRVVAGQEMALLYVDLDHFKAYNDHYGFLRGDEAIRALAEVMRKAVDSRQDAFLGHVGGDDFVLLARPDEAEGIADDVISAFEARVPGLYEPDDAARGWIELNDRRGRKHRYDLLTLSIGVAANVGRPIEDHRRLVDVATEMKEFAKSRVGNAVAVDQRSGRNLGALVGRSAERFGGLSPSVSPGALQRIQPRSRGSRRSRLIGVVRRKGRPDHAREAPRRSLGGRFLVHSATALVAVALVAGPTTVVLAENARPGELLWPVKLRIEDARLILERNLAKDLALHLEFASRRIGDLQYVLASGSDSSLMATVTESLAGHTDAAVLILRRTAEEGLTTEVLRAQARMVLAQNVEVLQGLVATACAGDGERRGPPEAACPGLQRAFEGSSRAMQLIKALEGAGGDSPNRAPQEPPGTSTAKDLLGKGDGERPGRTPPGRGPGEPGHGPGTQPLGQGADGEPPGQGHGSGQEPGQRSGAQPPGKSKDKEPPGEARGAGAGGGNQAPPAPEPPAPPEEPGGGGDGPPENPPGKSN